MRLVGSSKGVEGRSGGLSKDVALSRETGSLDLVQIS